MTTSVISPEPGPMPPAGDIHLNQVGFLPKDPKRAVVSPATRLAGNEFSIVSAADPEQVHYNGALAAYRVNHTGDSARAAGHFFADFDGLTHPGRYRLRLKDGRLSHPFTIGRDVYAPIIPLVSQFFDIQRCGPQPAGVRSLCHSDDGVIVGGPRDGQPIDASGGWHDAGDYLKFVETTSYVAALMLFAFDHFPKAFAHHHGSHMPRLLEQARVGLDWLLKMHPGPDEFYYQVGDAGDHDSWRLPENDTPEKNKYWKPRTVLFGVGANLAGRTAAALAMASRLYRPYDPAFAARCRTAAQSVYRLGAANPEIISTEPADFYPEKTWEDDMEWGAVELYRATGAQEYLKQALHYSHLAGAAGEQTSVYNTHALAHYVLYHEAGKQHRSRLRDYLQTDAEVALENARNPYELASPLIWGTAEAAAGAGINCLLYAALSGNREYAYLASRQRDYILGCNPFDCSFLIGAGTRYPSAPHHQVANLTKKPLLGALVGGPTTRKIFMEQQHSMENAVLFSSHDDDGGDGSKDVDEIGVYHDVMQDYVTNEPANDYTVKFLLLTAFYNN